MRGQFPEGTSAKNHPRPPHTVVLVFLQLQPVLIVLLPKPRAPHVNVLGWVDPFQQLPQLVHTIVHIIVRSDEKVVFFQKVVSHVLESTVDFLLRGVLSVVDVWEGHDRQVVEGGVSWGGGVEVHVREDISPPCLVDPNSTGREVLGAGYDPDVEGFPRGKLRHKALVTYCGVSRGSYIFLGGQFTGVVGEFRWGTSFRTE